MMERNEMQDLIWAGAEAAGLIDYVANMGPEIVQEIREAEDDEARDLARRKIYDFASVVDRLAMSIRSACHFPAPTSGAGQPSAYQTPYDPEDGDDIPF